LPSPPLSCVGVLRYTLRRGAGRVGGDQGRERAARGGDRGVCSE